MEQMAALLTAKRLEFACVPDDAVNDGFYIRIVIADEHDERAVLAFEVSEAVHVFPSVARSVKPGAFQPKALKRLRMLLD